MLLTSGQIEYAPVMAAMHALCFNEAWSEESFHTLLQLPTTIGWLNDKGFLLCTHVLDELEILTIGVLPEYRRQKIASRLLDDMLLWANHEKIKKIFLEVSAKNVAAQSLYQKAKFIQTGLRIGYYQTPQGPVDALCLTRELTTLK